MADSVDFSEAEMRTLCASSLFRSFEVIEIARCLTEFDVRRAVYGDGQVVAMETDAPSRMGIVLSGFLHVYDAAFKGQRHLVRIVGPGEIVGATLMASETEAYPAFVTAFGETVVATFALRHVRRMLLHGCRLFDNLACVVRDEVQANWRKIAILSCPNIAERVLLYLRDRSRREGTKTFAIGSTEAEFAEFLGVSRPALARVLRALAREGRFRYKRDVFTLT